MNFGYLDISLRPVAQNLINMSLVVDAYKQTSEINTSIYNKF